MDYGLVLTELGRKAFTDSVRWLAIWSDDLSLGLAHYRYSIGQFEVLERWMRDFDWRFGWGGHYFGFFRNVSAWSRTPSCLAFTAMDFSNACMFLQ